MLRLALRRLHTDDRGVTLVELLVVVLILGVVGSVAASGIITGMQETSKSQQRVEALAELGRVIERTSREVRVADGSEYPAGVEGVLLTAGERDLELDSVRDSERTRFRYWSPSGSSQLLECAAPAGAGVCDDESDGRVVLSDLVPDQELFTYLDGDGEEATGSDVRKVLISIERDLPAQEPVGIETIVTLRNAYVH